MGYATLIVLLAIVPVAVMEGRPGAFFEPMVLAYALAAVAAMVVALTLTPALSLMLFSLGTPGGAESPVVRRLLPRYDGALSRFVRRPRTALIAAGACVVVVLAAVPLLDSSVIPSFKDRDVLVRLDSEPGTSKPRMTQLTTQLSRELRSIPGVENVGAHVGRAIDSATRSSTSTPARCGSASTPVPTTTRRSPPSRTPWTACAARGTTSSPTRRRRSSDVGAVQEGENPVTGDGLDLLTGSDKPLVVRVFGQDLGRPAHVRRPGCSRSCRVSTASTTRASRCRPSQSDLEIEVDLAKAPRRRASSPATCVARRPRLLQGIEVGSVFEDQKVFDVIVKGTPATRRSVASVRNLLIDKPGGGHVRLGDVADVRVAQTPAVIERDAVSRYLDVEAGRQRSQRRRCRERHREPARGPQAAARVPRGGAAGDDGQGDQLGPHAGVRARLCDRDLPPAPGRLRRLAAGGAGVRHACRSRSRAARSPR